MIDFLKHCNGMTPRPEQADYLSKLSAEWDRHNVFALNAAPGVGKSLIARAITRAVPDDSAILTTSNQLVDQYVATYPELVPIKGVDHYADERDLQRDKRRVLRQGEPGIFNPLSFYYTYIKTDAPSVIVVDEAHQLAGMLINIVTRTFSCRDWGIEEGLDDAGVLTWLNERLKKLHKARHVRKFAAQYDKMRLLMDYIEKHMANIQISYQVMPHQTLRHREPHLCINPLIFPRELVNMVFKGAKLVFMSGTLYKSHLDELGLSRYHYADYGSPVPRENRKVQLIPIKDRKSTAAMVTAIRQIRSQAGNPATLIHIPYSKQKEFKAALPGAISHTKDTKQQALANFKRRGGILLASGMAEGIDLPGDLCRLIIVPRLLYPYLGDDAVKKRMAMPDGQLWYSMQTAVTTVQQIYRGLRSRDDWCNIVILDSTFPRLIRQTRDYLPQDFLTTLGGISNEGT